MPFPAVFAYLRNWCQNIYSFFFSLSKQHSAVLSTMANPETQSISPATFVDVHASNLSLLTCLSVPSGRRPALPLELILQVLEDPTRWLLASEHMHSCTLPAPKSISYHLGTEDVASTPAFTFHRLSTLRRISFILRSKDQGWSSYPNDRGTFRNSWTWFEARIERPPVESPEQSQEQDRANNTSQICVHSCRVQTNRHAGSDLEEYTVEYGPSSELLHLIQEGDRIILSAHAQYGGWVNVVDHASIELWCVDDLEKNKTPLE